MMVDVDDPKPIALLGIIVTVYSSPDEILSSTYTVVEALMIEITSKPVTSQELTVML